MTGTGTFSALLVAVAGLYTAEAIGVGVGETGTLDDVVELAEGPGFPASDPQAASPSASSAMDAHADRARFMMIPDHVVSDVPTTLHGITIE
ncbi:MULTISPECIES: hypothetical protein [Arthrobacter]|uniref:Secreted protein n=2 Tax=Arthrobacter TaxID=1663 RepID=A0ABU9KP07_9MICC|nr:hypothetical protein [Arthrobacter sp. YJM1]